MGDSSMLFGNNYIESTTVGSEVLFFTYEPSPLDIEPMWDVGNDDYMDDLDNDCLSLYNEH